MTKDALGAECKICARPFCVFRWKPGSKARYKKTEVCQSCSKIKNCCQTCLLDLQYGLPLQVRDQFLAQNGATAMVPTSAVNREFFARQQEAIYASGGADAAAAMSDQLCRLARSDPYYRRNLPKICSFFLKGECTRGAECPYRHEQPPHEKDSKLATQNMKDRYYGVNDPVADKMLARAAERPKMTPPADVGICTLYCGGLAADVTEQDVRDTFYAYGEIRRYYALC
jgi:pre-mRNA-splicing factor RBM22/SLT11